jgi:hypothetical protein
MVGTRTAGLLGKQEHEEDGEVQGYARDVLTSLLLGLLLCLALPFLCHAVLPWPVLPVPQLQSSVTSVGYHNANQGHVPGTI